MRKLVTSLAVIAVLGWAVSAQAGTVNSTWDLSGSAGKTRDTGTPATVTASAIAGTMCLTFSNTLSTSGIPHSQSTISMGCFTSTAMGAYGPLDATLNAKLQSAVTGLHLSSNGQFAGSASGKFQFTSIGHCAFFCGLVPGDWNASVTKTQMFTATIHLPGQNHYSANGNEYLGSGTVTITPPGGHLISSNGGYHTMHLNAKRN